MIRYFLAATLALSAGSCADEPHSLAHLPGNKCLNEFTLQHDHMVSLITHRMHNPASFEHVSTLPLPASEDGTQVIHMRYRGTNAFGAIVTQSAQITVNYDTCEPVPGSLERVNF